MPVDTRRIFVRFASVIAGAGTALALSVMVLIPSLRPFVTAAAFGTPPATRFKPLATRSVVLARDGSELAVLHADENRELAKIKEIPRILQDAIIDTEDRRFWHHRGIDLNSIARAVVVNSQEGRITQGGSTITQQLVKNQILTSEKGVDRKVKEAALALRLEQEMGKKEILERYLNTIYFGEGAYGVQAAMERFFGKQLADVTPAEAALLAGMIRDPLGYNPFANPQTSRARRTVVLRKMLAERHITARAAKQAGAEPLPAAPAEVLPEPKDHFVEEVKRRLLIDPRLGSSYQQRYNQLFRGGLRIWTTLDPAMQQAAQRAVDDNLPQSPFTAALVSMDPANGEVRALVGGPNFEQAKFNLATQGARQPGSSFKAVTLAAAIEDGHSPYDTVDGTAPCSFMRPGWLKPWNVDNYEAGGGGVMSLMDATVHSLNCAYANVVLDIGPQKVVDMAHKLGVQTSRKLDAFPSITLGSEEVTPLEMANVFSTFAADGIRHDPVFVTKVERARDKHVLFETKSEGKRAIEPQVARSVTSVLQEVVKRGTGVRAAIDRPAAGKTGTAEDWHDAWFCGFTPQLATVVWMGHPAGQIPMYNVGGVRVVGGTYPAQIWSAYMKSALENSPVESFAPPDTKQWGRGRFIGQQAPPPSSLLPEEQTSTLPPEFPVAPEVPVAPTLPPRFQPAQPVQPSPPSQQQPVPNRRPTNDDCEFDDYDC